MENHDRPLIDREPAVADPAEPAPLPLAPFVVALDDVSARYAPEEPLALDGFSRPVRAFDVKGLDTARVPS